MNSQVRKLFALILGMFLVLGAALTLTQVITAPQLMANPANTRRVMQATERDRGPIIVAGEPVAYSQRLSETSERFQRHYAEGTLYAHATGFFSAINLEATGIEAAEYTVLEGDTSQLFFQRMRNLFAGRSRQGGGVELTIDPQLQEIAAEAMGDRAGAVVVLDAETSAILAFYSSPTYDPNPLASLDSQVAATSYEELLADPARPLNNRVIASDRYAPGSVFKIITAVAMLESGTTTEELLESPTSMTLPGTETTLSNIDGKSCGSGEVTLAEAFARSCNTTFALAAERMPPNQLRDTAEAFGFGADLSIPLAVTPSVFPEETNAAQLATSAIGQYEVQVTPLQMAMVTQAIANDGVMMRPYLVSRLLDADNREVSATKPKELRTPVTPETAETIAGMMQGVVDESYGTGQSMKLTDHSVAAKTGTAEVGDGSYANAWAVAFAPVENPQLVVAVIVEGDSSVPVAHGGAVAGPIVRSLLEAGLE